MKPRGKRKRPTHLGRYELIEEIGRGGMGVIFKGHDPRHDREVAIKVLPKQGPEDQERVARFKREVQTIAMLSHQGIVRIFDVGEDDGRYYFVMEYVEGESVKAAASGKGIALRRGLEIIEQMCRAIGHAHRKGVIHRDINPNNILLDAQGRPVLIDFGIAKLADTSRLTRAGATIGTPRYLSPEQALGEPDVDERTDVYGLGATLYLIATGRPPFSEAGGQTVSLTALEQGPTDPRSVNARVPREVEQIIKKAMARRRGDRYRSCSEMATDLRSYLDTGKLALQHPGGLPKPLVIGLSAALVLVLAGGVIAMFGGGGDPTPDRGGTAGTGTSGTGTAGAGTSGAGTSSAGTAGTGTTPKPAGVSAEAREFLADAKDHLSKGRFAKAVAAFSRARAAGAPEGEVLLGRAEANAGNSNFAAALKDLAAAAEVKDFGARAELLERKMLEPAVQQLLGADDLNGLIVMLDRWLKVDPEKAGKVRWALDDAFRMAKQQPGFVNQIAANVDSPATQLCGALYNLRVKHQADSARDTLSQLTTDYPGFVMAWRALAGVQARGGRVKDASVSLRKALWLDPGAPGLGAEAWIILKSAGDDAAAAAAKDKSVAVLAEGAGGDQAAGELAFFRRVVDTYDGWDDALGAAHACDYVLSRIPRESPLEEAYRVRSSQLIQRYDLIAAEQLPSAADRAYRRAVTAAVAAEVRADQVEAALSDLDNAAIGDAHRMISADYYAVRASLLIRLKRWPEVKIAAQKALERDGRYRGAVRQVALFALAEGELARAETALWGSLPDIERTETAYSPDALLLRIAQSVDRPGLGLQAWVEGVEGVERQRGEASFALTLAKARLPLFSSMRDRVDRVGPAVIAYEAAARHLAGEDSVARAQIAEAARRLSDGAQGKDGFAASRVAAGLAWLGTRMTGQRGKNAAETWRMLRDLLVARTVWDGETAPDTLRRLVWMNVGQAMLAGGCPGRARQAFARAGELGADGDPHRTLTAEAEAALQRRADTAFDRYQLALIRNAAGDALGYKSALKRARSRADDGTLLPGELETIESLINGA